MNARQEGIRNAIEYIEQNITGEISVKDVATKAYLSEFHFRRIFAEICGLTIGEYIRKRRLAIAARELSRGDMKVMDAAVKYGYDSSDSFARAFAKFHGVMPSMAKEKGVKLRDFSPLKINALSEGGNTIEYKIVEKAAFTLMGRKRRFDSEDSYDKIPKFWEEHWEDGGSRIVLGMYGLCADLDGRYFDYYIADNYMPNKFVPDGYEAKTLPAGTWAVFPCTLGTLQDTNTKMWKEWILNCREYKLSGNYNIEMYTPYNEADPQSAYCEIWLPIEKYDQEVQL